MTNKQHKQNQNQKRAGGAKGMAQKKTVGRRDFLKYAGMATAAAGSVGTAAWAGGVIRPDRALAQVAPDYDLYFGGTDGWIWLPETPALGSKHPDDISPAYNGDGTFDPNKPNTYIFGFRNLTGMTEVQANNQKFKAQHMAPLFWTRQYDDAHPQNEFKVAVTNLGLELRPDLFDAHTLHWHGFRNVIPFFDGEPSGSVAIPSSRVFTYAYRAREEGTYMYHCHVEDTEHVHMGMTGLVFVRPLQEETNPGLGGFTKYLYNDGDGSTGFDREFAMFLSEVWVESHWADSHVELPEWSDYRADFAMLNGRTYPETLLPNASIDPANPVFDADGDLIPIPGHEKLQYQPYSSLVQCNAGERVALRFANLGFKEAAMTLAGIPMRVVGKDATHLEGRDGTDGSYLTDTININAGESHDVLFEAPTFSGGAGSSGSGYDRYFLYNRNSIRSNNLASGGFGGQATEVHVYPPGTFGPQTLPNAWGTPAA
jgi:FtsP/CotA-like multicopper oxidase with cupredoxin domain